MRPGEPERARQSSETVPTADGVVVDLADDASSETADIGSEPATALATASRDRAWMKVWGWLTVGRRLGFAAGVLVGIVLGSFALFDAGTLGSIVAGCLLIVAHACIPIYLRRVADRLAMTEEDKQQERVTSARTSTLVAGAVVWILIVFAVDRWILRLPIPDSEKAALLIPGLVVMVLVTGFEIVGFVRARRRVRRRQESGGQEQPSDGGLWHRLRQWIPPFVVSAAAGAAAVVLIVAIAGYLNQRD